MFSSIKWKFVTVYLLLVLMAMIIVGVFIVQRFEAQQLENRKNTLIKQIETLISSSDYLSQDNWLEYVEDIQNTLNRWRFSGTEVLYIIYDIDIPRIIASSHIKYDEINGANALAYKSLDPSLIYTAYNGEIADATKESFNENTIFQHVAYPVVNEIGQVRGILYMTDDIQDLYRTIDATKTILISATMLALIITVILGFLIASSITEPIRDVTKKAEKMAKGDFEQFVEVKSDDEIGQLASMFNYLTLKLKDTIQEMDLEKSKLNTIFNYMADGVIAVDTNGQLIHANPVAIKILNLEKIKDELLHRQRPFPMEIMDLDSIDFNDPDTYEGSKMVTIKDSVYQLKYAPFRNEKNNVGGIIIVFQDITEHHKLDNMRKEFVANVSHELKTPITTIKSYTETLMDYKDMDPELSYKFLTVIDNECDRMTRIVRDLLQLSNLDYNKTEWKKVECQVKDFIEDIILKLEFSIKEKNHRLTLNIEDDLPNIVIDKDGIEQVILNVISNAIKYTPEGGHIEVAVSKKDDRIVVRVKDNGIGIPEEDVDRIFERFYRVDKGRSRELGGTGLGLSIAKEIVEANGGQIKLSSKFGVGTEVDIVLPIS
ncbi:MAG: cell wall metabolism sensor histidine kinase WalK [Tissierellia bacterium]|nr:cell wall metabolism sensor histidine kinase WalK [Tissierellia bacterium]